MSTADTLSADERAAILALIAHGPIPRAACTDVLRYVQERHAHGPIPRAACTDVLRYVQERHRYISDRLLGEVAPMLGMSAAELDEVATFYNLIFRRPVGETVMFLCDSITCWMMGQPGLKAHLHRRLGIRPGETTADGKLTLLPIVCLGHCDHAPAMLLGTALHGDLDCNKLDDLLCLERG